MTAFHADSAQASGPAQLAEWNMRIYPDPFVEFVHPAAGLRKVGQALCRVDQGTVSGKAHAPVVPESMPIVIGQFIQGIVASAMGIARPASGLYDLAGHGAMAGRTERFDNLRQRGNGLLMHQADDGVGSEGICFHGCSL